MKGFFNKTVRNIASQRGGTEFGKRLIKATYGNDTKEPKEKHVQYLISSMHGGAIDVTPKDVITGLNQKALEGKYTWAALMKVLVVYHRLINNKLLAEKTVDTIKKNKISFLSYEKTHGEPTQEDRINSVISKSYAEYLTTLVDFLQNTKFVYLPAEKETVDKITKTMDKKDLLKCVKKVRKMVGQLKNQLEYKDFCFKTRLHMCYMRLIFKDLTSIYNIYFSCIEILKDKFKSLNSKKKSEAFNYYENFLAFHNDFKSLVSSFPTLYNIQGYIAPTLYKPKDDTLTKLQKKMQKKPKRSKTTVGASGAWVEESKNDNGSEEFDFDEIDDDVHFNKTKSEALKPSKGANPSGTNKIKVDEFNTNALENLLNSESSEPNPRGHTMMPRHQKLSEDVDPFEDKNSDNLFEPAQDIEQVEEKQPDNIDELFGGKMSLGSTQSNTNNASSTSNQIPVQNRKSGFNNEPIQQPFQTNPYMGQPMAPGYNQFNPMGNQMFVNPNVHRFSAPMNPQPYQFY